MPENNEKSGHRQRLKARFLSNENGSCAEIALLELLLTYAIPQRDVQPLANDLIDKFGDLVAVLNASVEELQTVKGVKENTAILIKLINYLKQENSFPKSATQTESFKGISQRPLFEEPDDIQSELQIEVEPQKVFEKVKPETQSRKGTGLFGKSLLKEAIKFAPLLPSAQNLNETKEFLRGILHFNAAESRRRYSDYIIRRLFPDAIIDQEFLTFARKYEGRQELADLCYYRFCRAEPLMYKVSDELLIGQIGAGGLKRDLLKKYLTVEFPESKNVKDATQAIVETLAAGGIVRADRTKLTFHYREPLLASFAYILHGEFPEPGMYDINLLEKKPAMRAMLWNPARILPTLYELRNQGLISKVSEIDTVRQFTTRFTPAELVTQLTAQGAGAR